jgi:hypothetical protein
MTRRIVPLLLVGAVFLAGLVVADEPPGQDEPPVRLKKKNRSNPDNKPMTEPGKGAEDKKKEPARPKEAKETREPEVEPPAPEEDEKEILQRVARNARAVDERLARNDIGEGTQQTQQDILKDIESLLQRSQRPQQTPQQQQKNPRAGNSQEPMPNEEPQGGQQQQRQPGQERTGQQPGRQQQPGASSGTSQRPGGQQSGGRQSGGKQPGEQQQDGTQPGRQQGSGERPGPMKVTEQGPNGEKPGGKDGSNGKGAGGGSDAANRNRNADLHKYDVWGHLPETVRAKMDTYSNPEPFLPKYDDLIKKYYRTIAEQGRRKGD